MANPLTSAAAQVAPVQPATKFFDPSESLGIMQRYGMSTQARAFAEDALKSATAIERTPIETQMARNELKGQEWQLKIADREDRAYAEKKEYESTLGQVFDEMGKITESDPEFETKMGDLLQDPRAFEVPAVKAYAEHKFAKREALMREEQAKTAREDSLIVAGVERGIPKEEMTDETGKFNWDKFTSAVTRQAVQQSELKSRDKAESAEIEFYRNDLPVVKAKTFEQVKPIYDTRRKTFLDSVSASKVPLAVSTEAPDENTTSEFDKLNDEAPHLTPEAYVARLMKFKVPEEAAADFAKMDDMQQLKFMLSGGRSTKDPSLDPLVKSAMDLFNAAHKLGYVAPPKAATKPTPTQGKVDPANDSILNSLIKQPTN